MNSFPIDVHVFYLDERFNYSKDMKAYDFY